MKNQEIDFARIRTLLREEVSRQRLAHQTRLYKELSFPFICNRYALVNYIYEFNKSVIELCQIVDSEICVNIDDIYKDFEMNFDMYVSKDVDVKIVSENMENQLHNLEKALHEVINNFD